MVDIVDIGLRVDSTTVKSGERALDDFSKQAEKSERETGKFNATSSALTTTFKGLAIGTTAITASIGAAYAVMKPFALAQAEAEQSAARLNAVLRATGHAAGLSAGQINGMAEALAATTQFDDESIRNASAVMATFRNVQSSTFREGIELAADLSALLGGDLQSAVMQVGKALNEPEQGVAALSRAGIQFSEVQKQQIKLFVETNQLGKAQAIVIQEMRNQFGGTAQAMNSGITKSIKDLDKAWNELQEEIGVSVGPMFTSIVNGATAAANAMRQLISSANGTATDTRGGNWLETQTARINAMAGEIAKAEADLASKRDNPLAFWLPSESDLRARIEAIKTVIVAESRALNQQVIAAGGRPITDDDRAASAGSASERRRAAEQSAAQLAAAREEALKRNDLRPDVVEGEFGPDENRLATAMARQSEIAEALEQGRQEQAQARLMGIEESLQTEAEAMESAYTNRLFIVEDALKRGLITEQRYKELETQLWAQSEAEKSAVAMREAEQREQRQQLEFQNKMSMAGNVSSLLGSLASLSEGRGKKEFETSQRLARAQTIVSTATAAIQSYAWASKFGGPIAGGVAAAAAVAAGLAQLNKINETQYSGGGSIASATGGGAGGAVPGTSGGDGTASGTETSTAPVSRGVTRITIIANNNGIAYLDNQSMLTLMEKIREANLRNDTILLDPLSSNAQAIAAQYQAQVA